MINPHQIGPEFLNLRKVRPGLLEGGKELPGVIGRKRTISHTFDREFSSAETKEFSVNADSRTRRSSHSHSF